MSLTILHNFVSSKSDGVDATLVQPSNWNEEHVIEMDGGNVLGRDTSGNGVVQELPIAVTSTGNVTLTNATGFFTGAVGTTGQRPGSPAAGMRRFNSTLTQEEFWDGTAWQAVATQAFVGASAPRGAIGGLTLSAAGSTGVYGIAVGAATDSTDVAAMELASAYTKTLAAWAVGSGNGSLDGGSVAISTWYHVFEIQRPDTGVVDILASTSVSAPTLPTNYTLFRRIGSILTDASSNITKFVQIGDTFLWDVEVVDAAGISVTGSTPTLFALTVPPAVIVTAIFNASTTAGGNGSMLFNSPLQAAVGSITFQTQSNFSWISGASGNGGSARFEIITSTARQIRGVSSITFTPFYIYTTGWIDRRGKDN